VNVEGAFRIPESQAPEGEPNVPLVEEWGLPVQVHFTESPTAIVTLGGLKSKLSTVTLVVAAPASAGKMQIVQRSAVFRIKYKYIFVFIQVRSPFHLMVNTAFCSHSIGYHRLSIAGK
jgi:hypothetical protein